MSAPFGQTNGVNGGTFGPPSTFGLSSSSPLSYVYEPLDLSGISEPNVIVSFKNLQKKDSITKGKALEDLLVHIAYLENQKLIAEDAVLETWVCPGRKSVQLPDQ